MDHEQKNNDHAPPLAPSKRHTNLNTSQSCTPNTPASSTQQGRASKLAQLTSAAKAQQQR